jgi:hypothetical protein
VSTGLLSATTPRAVPRAAWLAWALAAGAGALALALARTPFAAAAAAAPSACMFEGLTGLACPTCGFTRAVVLLAHGAWRESFVLHPWALPLVAQLALGWLAWGAWLAGALRARPDRWVPHAVAANLAALVLVWALRAWLGALPA